MSVVMVVLVLFASLILPNVVRMGPAQQQRAIYGALLDFARQARQNAIQNGLTYALTYDSAKSQFVMRRQPPPTDAAQGTGSVPQPSGRPLSNVQSVSDLEQVKTLDLPTGVQASTFRVGTDSTDPSSWLIHFYPDGTSDAGGVDLTPGGTVHKSLQITKDGIPSLIDGQLPDPTEQSWPAGSYAPQG